MAIAIFIFILLTIFHFVYEANILPVLRLEMRFKLFKLRDELRSLEYCGVPENDEEVCKVMDDAICAFINRLPSVNISLNLAANKAYSTDEAFKRRVDHKRQVLNQIEDKKLLAIRNKLMIYSMTATLINSGGAFYVMLPIGMVAIALERLSMGAKSIKERLMERAAKVTFASDHDLNVMSYAA